MTVVLVSTPLRTSRVTPVPPAIGATENVKTAGQAPLPDASQVNPCGPVPKTPLLSAAKVVARVAPAEEMFGASKAGSIMPTTQHPAPTTVVVPVVAGTPLSVCALCESIGVV